MDKGRLERRVAGREQAKAMIELAELDNPDSVDAFLDELISRFRPKEQVQAEQDIQKRRLVELASFRLTFGMHEGARLDEVPRDYLDWLLRSSEELVEYVGGYLNATRNLDDDDQQEDDGPDETADAS